MSKPIHIAASHAISAIGIGVPQIWAAVRAGISRSSSSSVYDRWSAPLTMALVPQEALPTVDVDESVPFTAAQRRMFRLAQPTLNELLQQMPPSPPVPIFVGLPEASAEHPQLVSPETWLATLFSQTPALDALASQAFPLGRAAAFFALAAACEHLRQGKASMAIVGGVDTYFDPYRLGVLDAEERLLSERVSDGFVPGEGAAFLLLTTLPAWNPGPATIVQAAATAMDAGHRYSAQPAKGEGLSASLENLRTQLRSHDPAQVMFAGLNGESFMAKQMGVARLRHHDALSPDVMVEHPADCYGEVGAASGALLLALADAALFLGHREGPALVWGSSDSAPCGCAWLKLQAPAT